MFESILVMVAKNYVNATVQLPKKVFCIADLAINKARETKISQVIYDIVFANPLIPFINKKIIMGIYVFKWASCKAANVLVAKMS